MQDQYVGNFADYHKYALLRALKEESGLGIGICWMKTVNGLPLGPNPHRYLNDPDKWGQHDPQLFEALSETMATTRHPTTADVERLPCMAGFTYFREPVPTQQSERSLYMTAASDTLADAEVIFLDPNAGIKMPTAKGTSAKANHYITLAEAAGFYAAGRSLLIHQTYPPRGGVIDDEHRCAAALANACPDASVFVFAKNRFAFFLVIHPNHQPKLTEAANRISGKFDEEMLKLRTVWPEAGA